MSDHAAFRAAVAAAPDDDLPRLIYADWLDERGDVRGEFIRLQVAEARGEVTPAQVARTQRWARKLGRDWAGSAADHALLFEFRRGFVERVIMSAGAFLAHGEEVLDDNPIRQVTLIGASTVTEALARSPHLGQVKALHLTGCGLGDRGIAKLLATPCLDKLRTLRLGSNGLEDRSAEALARCRWLRNLADLDLSHNAIGDVGAAAIAASPHLRHLRRIDLSANYISPGACAELRRSAGVRGVEIQLARQNAERPRGIFDAHHYLER